MFSRPSVHALNHLLGQQDWARDRLQRFSGRTVQFDIAPFSFAYTVLPDGFLRQAEDGSSADTRCRIPPTLLPRLLVQDEKVTSDITTEGDPALLSEVFFLFRNLRWDAADDLSRVTGDVAAEGIVQLGATLRQTVQSVSANLGRAAAEFATEEQGLLARATDVEDFAREVDTLRDDLARLEQRIHKLGRA